MSWHFFYVHYDIKYSVRSSYFLCFVKLCSLHGVKEVQQLAETMLDEPSTFGYTPKHPFIVVEGLDGTGLWYIFLV